MIDTPRASNRSLAPGLSCWLLGFTARPLRPKRSQITVSPLFIAPTASIATRVNLFGVCVCCPTSPNAAPLRFALCMQRVLFGVARSRSKDGCPPSVLALVSELRSQRLESRLHSVRLSKRIFFTPSNHRRAPLTQFFGFLILDNLRCEGRIRAS